MSIRKHKIAGEKHSLFWLTIGLVLVSIVWIVLSMLVIPPIIENAYHNESLHFFNNLISGRENHTVDEYLYQWNKVSWGLLTAGVLLFIPIILIRNRIWHGRLFNVTLLRLQLINPLKINLIITTLAFLLIVYLYYFDPVGYIYFITEDYWAEYGTFSSCAITFSLLTWSLKKHRNIRKIGFIVLALVAFFVAMEEIGWGQRILKFKSPEFFNKHNYQSETNIHNMIYMPTHAAVGVIVLLWCTILPVLENKLVHLRKWTDKLGVPIVPYHVWPFFFLTIFFLTFSSMSKSDEVGELFLGIALAVLSLDLLLSGGQKIKVPHKFTAMATVAIFLYLWIITGSFITFFAIPGSVKSRMNHFAMKNFPQLGMYKQAEKVFDYINLHPEFLTTDTHLEQGRLFLKTGRHTKATAILELSLSEQRQLKQQHPQDTELIRKIAETQRLLGYEEEARHAFCEAIKIDKTRLEKAVDKKVEVSIRMSLVKTFLTKGECRAARKQISKVQSLNPNEYILNQLNRLLNDHKCK